MGLVAFTALGLRSFGCRLGCYAALLFFNSRCGPALCIGVAALVLAARGPLPGWLRIFSAAAGVCGILAPFFFTYFLFVLWTITAGIALALTSPQPRITNEPQPSLV